MLLRAILLSITLDLDLDSRIFKGPHRKTHKVEAVGLSLSDYVFMIMCILGNFMKKKILSVTALHIVITYRTPYFYFLLS